MIRSDFNRLAALHDAQGYARRVTSDVLIAQAGQQRDPLGHERICQSLRHFRFGTRQQMRARDDRNLHAHPAHHLRQLRTNIPRPNEDQAFGQGSQLKHALAVQRTYTRNTVNGWQDRVATRRDDDLGRGQGAASNHHAALDQFCRASVDVIDTRILRQQVCVFLLPHGCDQVVL